MPGPLRRRTFDHEPAARKPGRGAARHRAQHHAPRHRNVPHRPPHAACARPIARNRHATLCADHEDAATPDGAPAKLGQNAPRAAGRPQVSGIATGGQCRCLVEGTGAARLSAATRPQDPPRSSCDRRIGSGGNGRCGATKRAAGDRAQGQPQRPEDASSDKVAGSAGTRPATQARHTVAAEIGYPGGDEMLRHAGGGGGIGRAPMIDNHALHDLAALCRGQMLRLGRNGFHAAPTPRHGDNSPLFNLLHRRRRGRAPRLLKSAVLGPAPP